MKRYKRIARIGMLALFVSCGGGQLNGGADGGTGDTGGTAGTAQGGTGGTAGTGSGGTAGTGGIGGIGGRGGAGVGGMMGGAGGWPSCVAGGFLALSGGPGCVPAAPACGAACGNGQRDSCTVSTPGCTTRTDTEPCDGADLGGVSCTSLGYGSGSLVCTSTCVLNKNGCDDCMPVGNELLSCGKPPFDAGSTTMFALASSASEIGIAWLHDVAYGQAVLSFARLSRQLEVISSSTVWQGDDTGSCSSQWQRMAVAPLPSGWVVAVDGDPEVFAFALDATGQPVARTLVDQGRPNFANIVATPLLVPRPDGGPLLVWHHISGSPRAVLIATDGRTASAPIDLPVTAYPLSNSPIGAVYLDGRFHLLAHHMPAGGAGPSKGLTLVHLGSDGAIESSADILPDETISIAGVGAGAADIRVVYAATDPTAQAMPTDDVLFRRIDSTGNPLTAAVRIGQRADLIVSSPMIALGGDTVFLHRPDSYAKVSWMRLDPAGGPRAQGVIASVPFQLYQHDLVQNGSEMLAGWVGNTATLKLARLAP